MNEVYIDVRGLEISELFNTDLVSVEDLVEKLLEDKRELNRLNEKVDELLEYKEQYCEKYEFN